VTGAAAPRPTRMPTPLEKPIKRELVIDGEPYTVTLSPLGVRLVRKGFRKGRAVSWRTLLATLATRAADEDDDAA